MKKPLAHVTPVKRNEVKDIKRLIEKYKVLGIVNLENLPAFNLMKIKKSLQDKIFLKYAKKRLIKIAFDELDDEKIKSLKDRLMGIPALLFTNEDPFAFYQLLKENKSNVPARSGDIAPGDIIVPAGSTDFSPGPMIGELGSLGIKTSVEGGKIVIKSDKLLVEAGKEITAKSAELMTKLKMEPMEVGLNLVLTYENGEILESSILDIDVDLYENSLREAVVEGLNLAVFVGYMSRESVEIMIRKAVLEVMSLECGYHLSEAIRIPSDNESQQEEKEEIPEIKKEILREESTPQEIEKEVEREILKEKKSPLSFQNEKLFLKDNKEHSFGSSLPDFTVSSDLHEDIFDKRRGDILGFNDELVKQAQEKLKELTDKKVRENDFKSKKNIGR